MSASSLSTPASTGASPSPVPPAPSHDPAALSARSTALGGPHVPVSADLRVSPLLQSFVESKLAPRLGLAGGEKIWTTLQTLLAEFGPQNAKLLQKRDEFQAKLDECPDAVPSLDFLKEIGYVVEEEEKNFQVDVRGVDPEIAEVDGK